MSLRRSRRAPKTNSGYNVGDLVEIERNENVLTGRLAQLLTMGTSPNPRWLVKFDGQPYKDEEMYERAFGKLLSAGGGDDDDEEDEDGVISTISAGSSAGSQRRNSHSRKNRSLSEDGHITEEEKKDEFLEDQYQRQYTDSNAGSESEVDGAALSQAARDRLSAREARSRRRQAKIDDDIPIELLAGGKSSLLSVSGFPKQKRQRGEDDNEEVVKVKLLTGTLYLYRGKQRRAEFIRRV